VYEFLIEHDRHQKEPVFQFATPEDALGREGLHVFYFMGISGGILVTFFMLWLPMNELSYFLDNISILPAPFTITMSQYITHREATTDGADIV
jgi:hypothetical protein